MYKGGSEAANSGPVAMGVSDDEIHEKVGYHECRGGIGLLPLGSFFFCIGCEIVIDGLGAGSTQS